MPRPDPARERYWRTVIADSTASGLSRAEYCRRHDINVMHLRNWMKRLKQRDAVAGNRASQAQAVERVPRRGGRRWSAGKSVKRKPRIPDRPLRPVHNRQADIEFAEVRLVNTEEPVDKQCNISGPLEIVLPSNLTLRLAQGASLKSLSSLLTLLENR